MRYTPQTRMVVRKAYHLQANLTGGMNIVVTTVGVYKSACVQFKYGSNSTISYERGFEPYDEECTPVSKVFRYIRSRRLAFFASNRSSITQDILKGHRHGPHS